MGAEFSRGRLARLRDLQNPDGGWGYFPGRHSWLEPTCYALLALFPDSISPARPQDRESWLRGWNYVRSLQNPDGGWRPSAGVAAASWASALALHLHLLRGVTDESFRQGIGWLLKLRGTEGGLLERAIATVWKGAVEYDRRFKGWPWVPDTSSWIEPTAHTLLVLKKALRRGESAGVPVDLCRARIEEAENMILDRRSPDGGWNYGNRRVKNVDLPSYPETTAVALLGLQGRPEADLTRAIALAKRYFTQTRSRLARAWLAISLQNYGLEVALEECGPSNDILVTALEAIAFPQGGHQWLTPVS
ncbi:MAG: terpene cyclase/mutase family protein [Bryobacteraceae bacterium]|nr:terpene cyclase/mutase family protein [Bryobacteraceae bacterium]MDW8377347.1 terpene cyclase/mutase family protein [Bryobacterales bacterium]